MSDTPKEIRRLNETLEKINATLGALLVSLESRAQPPVVTLESCPEEGAIKKAAQHFQAMGATALGDASTIVMDWFDNKVSAEDALSALMAALNLNEPEDAVEKVEVAREQGSGDVA